MLLYLWIRALDGPLFGLQRRPPTSPDVAGLMLE
jgi:2-keto-myo-inositol isomerase